MSAAALERPEKVPVLEERSGATGHMKLAIRLPAQAIAGIQASAKTSTRNGFHLGKQLAQRVNKQQHSGMQPKNRSQRIADLRFRSRQAASNETLVRILLTADRLEIGPPCWPHPSDCQQKR